MGGTRLHNSMKIFFYTSELIKPSLKIYYLIFYSLLLRKMCFGSEKVSFPVAIHVVDCTVHINFLLGKGVQIRILCTSLPLDHCHLEGVF